MKRIVSLILALALTVGCLFILASCGGHSHTYNMDEWTSDATHHWHAASCEHAEEKRGYTEHTEGDDGLCTICGYEVGHIHTYGEEWFCDETYHWQNATCEHTDEKGGYAVHLPAVDGKCDVCGYSENPTPIYDLINNSKPTKITTQIFYVVEGEDGEDETYNGLYTMTIAGNDAWISYSYQRLATPAEALEEGCGRIKTVEGDVWYRNGLYSEDGENWTAQAPDELAVLNFKEEYLTNPSVNASQTSLTAEVTPANAVKIFNTDLSAEGNIAISVKTNGVNLSMIEMSANTKLGAKVTINTSYTYNPITIDFPGDDDGSNEPTADVVLDDFKTAINNTSPTSASIGMTVETTMGPLSGRYDITYAADGSATVTYSYEQFDVIDENNSNDKITVSGSAAIDPEGNVTGSVNSAVTSAGRVAFNLDANKMTFNVASGALVATVLQENTAAVVGFECPSDAIIALTCVDGVIVSATITYTTEQGAVEIVCTYHN